MASASRIEEWQPGNIGLDGNPADPNNPLFKIYKYQLGDVLVTNPDIASWPVHLGAEYHDYNENGVYDPQNGDLPKIYGSGMVWYVINDGVGTQSRLNGSKPMGLEAQVSAFYFDGGASELDHTVFIVYKLINKGIHPINDMVFSLWSDPDLGDSEDDLVGVDSTRSLAYCYNKTTNDASYGSLPPAFGYDFFLGPKEFTGNPQDSIEILGKKQFGYKAHGMETFVKYNRGDPTVPDPRTIDEARNYQMGYKFNGSQYDPLTDGTGGTSLDNPKIVYPGLPEQSTGWRDYFQGDKRMMINTKPFNMATGDTQVVVVGYVVGSFLNNLGSLAQLRLNSDGAQSAYNNLLKLVPQQPALGTLQIGMKNQFDQPIQKALVNVTPLGSAVDLNQGLAVNEADGSTSVTLYEGDYQVTVIGNPSVWGQLPDTLSKVVSITKSETSELSFVLMEQTGYWEKEWRKDQYTGLIDYWLTKVPGDTTFSLSTKYEWTPNNGAIRIQSSTLKGQWTLQTQVDLSTLENAGVSFALSIKLNASDTFRVQVRNPSMTGWILLDEFRTILNPSFTRHNYYLPSLVSFAEPIEIRFRFIKRSNVSSYISIDDFLIAEDVGVGVESEPVVQPSAFQLLSAYPNPFNPSTTLRWVQSHAGEVNLRVFNLLGQQVMSLPVTRPAGEQIAELDFSRLASGVYLVNAEARGEQTKPIRVVLIK